MWNSICIVITVDYVNVGSHCPASFDIDYY